MDTEERVRRAIELWEKDPAEFKIYLQELENEDRLAFLIMEALMLFSRYEYPSGIRKGMRLLPQVSGKPWLAWLLLIPISKAYRNMGEVGKAKTYLSRALEMAETTGDREALSITRLHLCANDFFNAGYDRAYKGFMDYRKDPTAWKPRRADYYLGICSLIKGQPERAIKVLDSFLEAEKKTLSWFGAIEMKALALRILGKFTEAMEGFVESGAGYIGHGSAYSAFPVAKALELARLTGLEPPQRKLMRKALILAKKGSWGEQAAAQEIEVLLREDDSEAAEGLYEASRNYLRAYQNIEAVFSGLTAAYLAWKTDSPVFAKALKLIAPLAPLHPGFKKDPLLGDFLAQAEPFLKSGLGQAKEKEGIVAYLIGQTRVLVDGREIRLKGWRRNKAIMALIYLLLSPKHRIPTDHLFYLLWPRRSMNKKNKWGLYKVTDTIRKNLGRRELLGKHGDFYQLEGEVWTDLGEIENLLRLADATNDPAEKEEYLARARELARGELLPEFPYDKHIEEYRYYYAGLRKRLFGESSPQPGG